MYGIYFSFILGSLVPAFSAALDQDEEFKDKIKFSSARTLQPATIEQPEPSFAAIDIPSWIVQISLQKNTPLCADMIAYLAEITYIPHTILRNRYEQALSATR